MNVRLLSTGIICSAVLVLSGCARFSEGNLTSTVATERNNLNGNLGGSNEEEQGGFKKSGSSSPSDHKKTLVAKEVRVTKPAQAPEKTEEKKVEVAPDPDAATAEKTAATVMVVNNSKAKLRKKPSTKGVVIKTLKKGEEVKVISQQEEWYQVKLKGGDAGWCHNSVLGSRP